MIDDPAKIGGPITVPIFPLPNVVLFPRAVLPLHIFEERYKEMTAYALSGDRLIAMALLRPGWEKTYHGQPAIEPAVCVGKIISHEQQADGCYNFLLVGALRARIISEEQVRSFRIAELELVQSTRTPEYEVVELRDRLRAVFERGSFRTTSIARQFRQMFADDVPTADLADLIAFNFVDNIALKQSLLADLDDRARIARVLSALESNPPPPPLDVSGSALDDGPSLN